MGVKHQAPVVLDGLILLQIFYLLCYILHASRSIFNFPLSSRLGYIIIIDWVTPTKSILIKSYFCLMIPQSDGQSLGCHIALAKLENYRQ